VRSAEVAAQLEEETSRRRLSIFANQAADRERFSFRGKTHRVVIVEQDRRFCGVGAEVATGFKKTFFDELDGPSPRITRRCTDAV